MDIEKLAERCMVAESCLPDTAYRTQLCKLHQEMLEEIGRLSADEQAATDIIDAINAENDALRIDGERLDWVEQFISSNDGLVLHNGGYKVSENKIGYSGLGLASTGRTLREAIDAANEDGRVMVKSDRKHLDQLGGPSESEFQSMRIAGLEDEIARLRAELESARVDAEICSDLVQIVEGHFGAVHHGVWTDRAGLRLKDTKRWARFYVMTKKLDSALDAARGGK